MENNFKKVVGTLKITRYPMNLGPFGYAYG